MLFALAAACAVFLAAVFLRDSKVEGLSAEFDVPGTSATEPETPEVEAPEEPTPSERSEQAPKAEDSRVSVAPAPPAEEKPLEVRLTIHLDAPRLEGDSYTVLVAPGRRGDTLSPSTPSGGFREISLRNADKSFAAGAANKVKSTRLGPRQTACTLDVTELVDEKGVGLLRVRVEAPGEYPHDFSVPAFGRTVKTLDGRTMDVTVELLIENPCVAWGTVAAPRELLRTARVAAFPLKDGVPASMPSSDQDLAPSEGSYNLPLECDRDHAIVAFADGCRPSTRIVPAGFRGELDLALERGESISGVVRVAGSPVSGLVRLEAAEPASREIAPRCSVGGRWLVWTGAGFEWDSMSVTSDENGRFEFNGLAPRAYTLSMGRVPGVYASDSPVSRVTAPANAVAVTPRLCRLDLRLFQAGSPAANVSFAVSEVGPQRTTVGSHKTDDSGSAVLWVDPDRATTIEVSAKTSDDAPAIKSKHPVTCPGSDQVFSMRIDY